MENALSSAGRWIVVHDPEHADFVLVWAENTYPGFNFTIDYASLYMLSSVPRPDWAKIPFSAAIGDHAERMVLEFAQKNTIHPSALAPSH